MKKMKKWLAAMVSMGLVVALSLAAFAAVDRENLDQIFREMNRKQTESILEAALGKEKAGELVLESSEMTINYEALDEIFRKNAEKQTEEMIKLVQEAEARLEGENKARDASGDQIKPDGCSHNYTLSSIVRNYYNDPNTGISYETMTYYYTCSKCGSSYSEVVGC